MAYKKRLLFDVVPCLGVRANCQLICKKISDQSCW